MSFNHLVPHREGLPTPHSSIRSYVLRQSRMSDGQKEALRKYWSKFGIELKSLISDSEIFFRQAPVILEIGFGMGESLLTMAKNQPSYNFLGVEVYIQGIARCLSEIAAHQLNNIRLIHADALKVLENHIADKTLDRVHIFFPDPWHKKRHHKRRLIQPPFIDLLVKKLKLGAKIHLATDWEDYALQMMQVLSQFQSLRNIYGDGCFANDQISLRPSTKFEARGRRLQHHIWDLVFAAK